MVQENNNLKLMKTKNKPKKYVCNIKVGNNPDKSAKCVKYRSNDLLKLTSFLDKKFPTWTWYNVFLKETGQQISSFTNKKRPITKDG
jgi:hypothetical protein